MIPFSSLRRTLLLFCLVGLQIGIARADFAFVPGHYYSSNYFERDIIEYDGTGAIVGTLSLAPAVADEIRGIAFGADRLLYATVGRGVGSNYVVLALDSAGQVHQTYNSTSGYIGGNISYGKIALDQQYIYVAAGSEVTRFTLGNPNSGIGILTNGDIFDVKILPGGNLFAASGYDIKEITSAGSFVRQIRLSPSSGQFFTDIRGIEYDPGTNDLFVTHLGSSDFAFRLMKVNATTGDLEENVQFVYADDIFLTDARRLLVGSRTEIPHFFTEDLAPVGMLAGVSRMFVTQFLPSSRAAGDFYFLSTPARFVDTRNGTGGATGAFSNGEVRSYTFSALPPGLVPSDALGVVGNVAVVPHGQGNLQTSPTGIFTPASPAFLNFVNGTNLSNHFESSLNSAGGVFIKANVFGGSGVDVIIDIVGYYR